MLLKKQWSRIRGKWLKGNQVWTKGGKEERSFRDMYTIQIQKSGIGTGNNRSPGDAASAGRKRGSNWHLLST